jgi:hypothetical protein
MALFSSKPKVNDPYGTQGGGAAKPDAGRVARIVAAQRAVSAAARNDDMDALRKANAIAARALDNASPAEAEAANAVLDAGGHWGTR